MSSNAELDDAHKVFYRKFVEDRNSKFERPTSSVQVPLAKKSDLDALAERVDRLEALSTTGGSDVTTTDRPEYNIDEHTCTHPDHNDRETCEDRAVGCSKYCRCCMGISAKAKPVVSNAQI